MLFFSPLDVTMRSGTYLSQFLRDLLPTFSFANGIDATHGITQYTTCTALANTNCSAIPTIFFGVVSIAQLAEVTDSAVLGGVAEVVSSSPKVGHKIFFSI